MFVCWRCREAEVRVQDDSCANGSEWSGRFAVRGGLSGGGATAAPMFQGWPPPGQGRPPACKASSVLAQGGPAVRAGWEEPGYHTPTEFRWASPILIYFLITISYYYLLNDMIFVQSVNRCIVVQTPQRNI